jgi:hypothetical protein
VADISQEKTGSVCRMVIEKIEPGNHIWECTHPFKFWMTFSRESVIDIPASSSWCLRSLIMAWNFMGSMLNGLSPQSHSVQTHCVTKVKLFLNIQRQVKYTHGAGRSAFHRKRFCVTCLSGEISKRILLINKIL